mmetsp:Transcript_15703/g.15049  ORF Transcript_15703/g.15049 Transcript_15703/m.15049 type:complete len:267 (-) Transcript_15703:87-887(-)|eukprot:CAMPEP_0119042966 /NCGR_PEP_ID=MMETSP1177-20130426/16307_1 /TAXON_ID=2985 /ORGANISM="Ochromonas sp, Strain CCMP1899" /LENGTH=266 /DNA_ID=CAMNT_0007010099 /DNA_START=343 /DNA_END=1143 /DNA_ORIENTATION=+
MGCGASSSPTSAESPSLGVGNNNIPAPVPAAGISVSRINATIDPSARPISRPLIKLNVYKHPTALTMGDLNNKRNEFWSTRGDGDVHMWQAIQSAAGAFISDDLILANAILEASNMATPNGSLELCYDELGRPYRTPLYCIVTPSNIVSPNNSPVKAHPTKTRTGSQATIDALPINLKIRINPGEINLCVLASTADSIQDLKHVILEQSSKQQIAKAIPIPQCDEIRQRIIFMGQELADAQLLGDVGVDESKVLQVFLRPLPTIIN